MSSSALRTPLAIGQREAHRTDHALITIQHIRDGHYMVVVEHGSTGARVDQLTSGPYTSEDAARTAARNAYRAFKSGRTVEQVITDLNTAVVDEIAKASRRRDNRRINDLNKVADQLATPAQAKSDADMLAGIRANLRKPAASFAEYRARTLAAFDRDRTEVAGQADLFETAVA